MDIAILKTQADASFKPLTFSETNVEKTDKVVAIGSPLGLMNLVSEGIVSGFTQIGNETVIQFTASISHGSSGGVLLNEAGEVVGVTFASYSAGQNLNMAIPIQYVRALYEQASPSEAVTVIQFFDAVDHIYPLTYVLEHGDEFMGKTVIFQVYVSSLTYYHSEPDSKAMFYLVENKSDSLGMTLQGRSYEFSSAFFIEHEKVKAWKAIEVWTTRSVASAKIHPGSMITISGTLTTLDDVFGDNDMSLTLKDFTIFD